VIDQFVEPDEARRGTPKLKERKRPTMLRLSGIGIVLGVILATTPAFAQGPCTQGPNNASHPLCRFGPAGGWNPDGRGLFHWWDRDCFTRPCTPDDYCRKPMPRLYCTPRPVAVGHAHAHPDACGSCQRVH
jgi:hypothetical protein